MSKYDASIDAILDIEANNIVSVKRSLCRRTMEEVIELMLTVKPSGRKVITAGCGTSGTLAERVAHTLCVVEVPATFCAPGNSIHGGMGVIQRGDVVVLFSKGGNTPEILNYIPCCKAKGATIIGVTQNDASTLAREADIYFKIVAEHESDMWDMCASASCNTIAAVWDAVAFTVMRHNGYTKADLLLTHPGGKVGEVLRESK
ncbi:SIS domain-containing protein [Bacillota bacterium Meth-B3]|nr:SIS domain-containing protein [Christensenellaceae bacterium]MEA5065170.1 SIS domain-containing protein [Eubacteriales bacterium]MEA5067373.1 SIS domain-containing protein [Christensenellaceae bacterium]